MIHISKDPTKNYWDLIGSPDTNATWTNLTDNISLFTAAELMGTALFERAYKRMSSTAPHYTQGETAIAATATNDQGDSLTSKVTPPPYDWSRLAALGYPQPFAWENAKTAIIDPGHTLSGLNPIVFTADHQVDIAEGDIIVFSVSGDTRNGLYTASSGVWSRLIGWEIGDRAKLRLINLEVPVYSQSVAFGVIWFSSYLDTDTIGTHLLVPSLLSTLEDESERFFDVLANGAGEFLSNYTTYNPALISLSDIEEKISIPCWGMDSAHPNAVNSNTFMNLSSRLPQKIMIRPWYEYLQAMNYIKAARCIANDSTTPQSGHKRVLSDLGQGQDVAANGFDESTFTGLKFTGNNNGAPTSTTFNYTYYDLTYTYTLSSITPAGLTVLRTGEVINGWGTDETIDKFKATYAAGTTEPIFGAQGSPRMTASIAYTDTSSFSSERIAPAMWRIVGTVDIYDSYYDTTTTGVPVDEDHELGTVQRTEIKYNFSSVSNALHVYNPDLDQHDKLIDDTKIIAKNVGYYSDYSLIQTEGTFWRGTVQQEAIDLMPSAFIDFDAYFYDLYGVDEHHDTPFLKDSVTSTSADGLYTLVDPGYNINGVDIFLDDIDFMDALKWNAAKEAELNDVSTIKYPRVVAFNLLALTLNSGPGFYVSDSNPFATNTENTHGLHNSILVEEMADSYHFHDDAEEAVDGIERTYDYTNA